MEKTKVLGFQPYDSVAPLPEEAIVDLCKRWKIEEFYLFDTILQNTPREYYDLDVMVVFADDAHWGWDVVLMEEELSEIFGRKINFATKAGVENPSNHNRQNDLDEAKLIYVTR